MTPLKNDNLEEKKKAVKKKLRIIKVMKEKDVQDLKNYKRPLDDKSYVGVEIECFSRVNEFELNQYLFHMDIHKYITVGHDSSIRPRSGYLGYEFKILAPENEISKVIKKFCRLMKTLDSDVNSSCGLHVHLDMRNKDRKLVFNNLVNAQPLLYAMNPPSRRTNGFSKPTPYASWDNSYNGRDGINKLAYERHKTIEVRVHSGTLDPDKINNWIKILLKIANKTDTIERLSKLSDYVSVYNFDKKLIAYIVDRLEKHNKNDKENLKAI
jgi:hypothetical protein